MSGDIQLCGDGRAAVELAGRLHPDVVVMNIRTPVLDGLEAPRLLAGAGVPHPVKVLVVTTYNLDKYVYAEGANPGWVTRTGGDARATTAPLAARGERTGSR